LRDILACIFGRPVLAGVWLIGSGRALEACSRWFAVLFIVIVILSYH